MQNGMSSLQITIQSRCSIVKFGNNMADYITNNNRKHSIRNCVEIWYAAQIFTEIIIVFSFFISF